MMRHCLDNADELREKGRLSDSQMLGHPQPLDQSVSGTVVRRLSMVHGNERGPRRLQPHRRAKHGGGRSHRFAVPVGAGRLRRVRPVQDIGAVRQRVSKAS